MDKKFIINFLVFITFGVLYFGAGVADYLDRSTGRHISAGVLWMITGLWCYLASRYFIRIHKVGKKQQEMISLVITVIGILLLVVAFL